MAGGKLTPIGRNNKFYSDEDFQYESSLIEEYIEEDLNQSIIVYEVDYVKTNVDTVYKETKQSIRYKTPKELPCMFEVKDSQTKSYDASTNKGVYSVSGNLVAYIPTFMFEKYKCNIKRGDYVGVQIDTERMAYFVVTNDDKLNIANSHYVGAYKTLWRMIEAAPVVDSEFNGK